MATEAHTTEPVALLERGTSKELTAAEFNQPAEIANYLEKSENVKTPIDAELESGIEGNAGAPEGGSFFESPTVVKVPVVKEEIHQDEDLDAAEGTSRKDNEVANETEEIEGKGITNNETVEVKNEYADAVEDSFELTRVACKDEHKETEILDKTGEADNLALTHEEGKQSVIKEQVLLDASAEEGRDEDVHTVIAAEDNIAEVAAAPEEMPSPKEKLIQTDEPENEKIESSEKVSFETETAASNGRDTISDSGIPSEEISPQTTLDEKAKNADDQHPTRSLEEETGDEKLKPFYDSHENWDIKDAGKNMEEADPQVEISATSSNVTESKDEERPVFNDNIVERTFEPENIQEAETNLQVEVGEDVKEKTPEENVERNSRELVDEDQTEDLQSDDKMTGQSGPENFEEYGTDTTIDNAVKQTNQIDGITNLTAQECLQSENQTLAVELINNVKEDTEKEDPRENIKDKEIASKDDIIEVQDIIQTKAEAEDTGKEDNVVEDKIEAIARETHEDPLQEEKGDDLDNTELKEEIEDSKKEFTESIEERGYVEERESEILKGNEEPKSDHTPAKASEETMLQKDVDESLAKIPTSEPENREETLEIERYDIDDSNSAPTTTKEAILEEGKSEDKVEIQSSNLARGMESDKRHQIDVDAESENATNLDGSRDPETAVVENEVEEPIEHEIQTETPIEGTQDQTIATARETPSGYMSDDIMKECAAMPSQDSEFVSSEASEIVDEDADADEKSKTSLPEVVEEEKAGTYNNELEAADTEIITQQECASKTMTVEEGQEISCDTNQSDHEKKMTDSKNESSEFAEQTSQEGHHETQEKEEPEEPREQVKETQDADEIVKAVILTEEVQDVEEADGKDRTVKHANEEKEVIMEPHSEHTEAESGEKEEESISPEQFKASDFNEQRETVSSDVQEASVMENEILIEKKTDLSQEQDEAEGKSTGDSSTAAVQQSEEKKREITQGEDGPPDKIKEITTSETSLNQTQIDEKTAHASNTNEDESSIDTIDVEARQQDDVVNTIAEDENSSNLASEHLAENTENATEEQIADSDVDVAEERKKASEVHEFVDHDVEDVNAETSTEDVKEGSETVFTSRNIEALEKCEVSADPTVTENRTKEELTPSPEVPFKEEEYETKTDQNEEGSTKEVGIVNESSAKPSASNSTNEVCVSELGLDSPSEVHEENKGTLDEKVEVKETSEAGIEHVAASDQTFPEEKGLEHAEVCIQTNEPRELEASQPNLEFNEDKKHESQDETDEKKEAPEVISEASVQTLPVQRTDGQNQTSSELRLEEQEDGISASMDVVAEEEISSDQTLLTEKMEEQKETLSEQEHLASATNEREESSKEVEVLDDENKTTKEVSLQFEEPEEHESQKEESPKEVREDEDSSESREYIKEAAEYIKETQAFEAPKEDEIASDTTHVTEERSEGESLMPSDAMIDETPATPEHIKQLKQEGENIEKSACFSTEGTKEVEALEVELKVNANEVSNKDRGTPEEVSNLQAHEKPSNDVESEEITGSEVQSYEKNRESEESEVKEEHLVAAIPEFGQTNEPKETVDATDVAGNETTNKEVGDKKEDGVSSSPVTFNEEPTKESSQLHELIAEAGLGDDMMEKEIQNKKESDAEISDVKESVGEVEISKDENVPIAKSGEPSEIPSAQEKPEEYIEVTTKEREVVEDESVSLPKEEDTMLETCHSNSPLDAEEQKEAPKEVNEEEDSTPAETREEIKKDFECKSVPNSDSQGTKYEIVSGDSLGAGKILEEKSKTTSTDLASQITTLLEETEDQAKPQETQGDRELQPEEQESHELALEKESKEDGEVPDKNQTVVEERKFQTENEEVVGLSKETSNLKTNTSEETSESESESYGSEVKDTQREEAVTYDTTEPILKEVINERITEEKDDAKGTEENPGENLGDQRTTEEPQTEEEVDTDISNAQDAVEDDTITTDKSFLAAKLDEIHSDALLSEEEKQGTSETTDLIKEAKGVEGTEEPKAPEEVSLQKEEPSELGVSLVETQLDKYVLEAPKEVHEEATTKQMEVIGDVPVIKEEASWQKEEPRELEISESKRPLDADVQMDSQKETTHEEEDSAPIETKDEIKEQGVSTDILDTKEAVEEDQITSEKSLPDSKLDDEKNIQSVALFSEEHKHVTSEPTECIKEVIKGAEGTEVEPLQKEEPRELEVFQVENQLNKYVQETQDDVHEEAATTKEVEVVGDTLNIMDEASLQKEEPREPEISESYRLFDADVKMDSQNEVQAEVQAEDEVESKSMSYSNSQVFEAPEEDKITSAETFAAEEKSEEQSQIPFAALVSETTVPSEKEEQEKAVETPEDDKLQNSSITNDLEAESVTDIVGLPEGTTNIKNRISEETLESESEMHGNEVITKPGKTEIKEEEALATKIVDNEVINNVIAEDKGVQTVCEVTTTDLHQEPQTNLDESLKEKTIEELQTKEDFFTEKSDAKEEIVEEKVSSDKDLLMAKSEEKIQIQPEPAALHLEEQTHGASATIESREVAMDDIQGIRDESKTAEEVPEAHSHLEGSKLETSVRNCKLESPRELQQRESEVTGKTREETKGTSETPLKFDSNETEDKTDSKEISSVLASATTTVLEKFEDPKREVETPGNESPQISKEESKEIEEGEASKLENTVEPVKVQQINLTEEQVTEPEPGTIIESQQKSSEATQNEKVEKSQEEEIKTVDATSGDKKTHEAEETGTSEGKLSLQDMLEKSTRQWPQAAEETEDAKSGGEEEDAGEEQKKCDSSGSDAPVVVEALTEMEIKTPHKKSLLSGVGSKVKHSISKVKKAITGSSGKSSSQAKQQHSPK